MAVLAAVAALRRGGRGRDDDDDIMVHCQRVCGGWVWAAAAVQPTANTAVPVHCNFYYS